VWDREDLLILRGVLERAREQHGPIDNPAARAEELKTVYDHGRIGFFSPEAVIPLADAASSEQDRALYITTAFSGLRRRGELLALRWRAVDFDQEVFRVVDCCGQGELWRSKSGRPTVSMVEQVEYPLMKGAGRERHTQLAGLVSLGSEGGCMDSSALAAAT
jgi:integrase